MMLEILLFAVTVLIIIYGCLMFTLYQRSSRPKEGRLFSFLSRPKLEPGSEPATKEDWRKQYRVDSLLEGIDKFETIGWEPPPKWKSSDRIAFILSFLFEHRQRPASAQYIWKHGRKAGDTTSDSAYAWWLGILEHEGMVARDPDGQRPIRWAITCNRRPLHLSKTS
jgi:hypothetical protein